MLPFNNHFSVHVNVMFFFHMLKACINIRGTVTLPEDSCMLKVFWRIKFHLEKNPSFKRHVWLYDQADIVGLNQSLINIPWYTWYDQSVNMDNVWAKWSTSFLNSCKQFIPNRDIIVRPKDKPWVDHQLKALLRRRNRLWRRWKRTGQEEHHSVYKLVRNEAVSLNRKKYAAFCNRIHVSLSVHNPSPKMFWSLTKVLMGSKVSTHIHSFVRWRNSS